MEVDPALRHRALEDSPILQHSMHITVTTVIDVVAVVIFCDSVSPLLVKRKLNSEDYGFFQL